MNLLTMLYYIRSYLWNKHILIFFLYQIRFDQIIKICFSNEKYCVYIMNLTKIK
jgi:hypothetical protein